MDRIVFFSESQLTGKVPRDFENARTEFGWSIMLDAEWCPIGRRPEGKIDLGIIIVPKNNPVLKVITKDKRLILSNLLQIIP